MSDFVIKNGVLKKYTGEESKVVIPDSVTEIGDMVFSSCEDLVIKAPENSYAHKYAKEKKIKFEAV